MKRIENLLRQNADPEYKSFQGKLIPTVDDSKILGVRIPMLRSLAKQIYKDKALTEDFLNELPHCYYDENQLHGLLVSEIKDFDECITRLIEFLPYVDNWATCDSLSPKCFKKNPDRLLPYIDELLSSENTYSVRFGILCLMRYFLDENYNEKYLKYVVSIRSDEYYINMMIAWYMATALAKQWDSAVIIIENGSLDKWVHNKTIQKAVESYRISPDQKTYLRTLKR